MEPVLAYIDPGSGSLIIQALIAGIVAAPIIFRRRISSIMRTLRGKPEPSPSVEAPPREDTSQDT